MLSRTTAGRKWINYEIKAAWNSKKGVVGAYVHRLKDLNGYQSARGNNPVEYFNLDGSDKKLSSVVKAYIPPYTNSKDVYVYINDNLANWIEEAIAIREDN